MNNNIKNTIISELEENRPLNYIASNISIDISQVTIKEFIKEMPSLKDLSKSYASQKTILGVVDRLIDSSVVNDPKYSNYRELLIINRVNIAVNLIINYFQEFVSKIDDKELNNKKDENALIYLKKLSNKINDYSQKLNNNKDLNVKSLMSKMNFYLLFVFKLSFSTVYKVFKESVL
ncbi:hypothetical protein VO56_00925 [Mycoplasmopsis gallinacea]|uniref:Uncharacterized protein n=1 Tax=Mycoplasmopsis gallinacea TaxID=29556 RepID=A0A0D5ZJC6_9BACT|nr:hypothetical protein VO56_00925 [Mycoplasmopsis gallinacea]